MSITVRRILFALFVVPAILAVPVRGSDCDGCGDRGCHAGTAADDFVADRVGLVREWIVRLPFESSRGQLRSVTIGDGIVVATSGDGSVHAIAVSRSGTAATANGTPAAEAAAASGAATPRPAAGSILWSTRVDGIGGTSLPAGIGRNTVVVAGDLGVVALDADGGGIRWRENFGVPAAAAMPIGDSVYVPLAAGRIRRTIANPLASTTIATPAATPAKTGRGKRAAAEPLRLLSDRQLPDTVDGGGRLDRPVMPFGNDIAWTTRSGLLIALDRTTTGWDRHEFDLLSMAVDAPLVRGRSIFAATVGGDLARVDMPTTGLRGLRTGWHAILDHAPDAGPLLGGNTIVVSLGDDGLAAFAADTGRPVWRSSVAGRVLAVGGDRVWLIDQVGRLSAIDMATGERRERVCLGCLTMPIVNAVNDRLFLASADGLLVCLKPKRSIPDAFPAPTPEKRQKRKPVTEGEREPPAEEPKAEAPAAGDDR